MAMIRPRIIRKATPRPAANPMTAFMFTPWCAGLRDDVFASSDERSGIRVGEGSGVVRFGGLVDEGVDVEVVTDDVSVLFLLM